MMKVVFAILITCLLWSCSDTLEKSSVPIEELTIAQIHAAYQNGDFTVEDLVNAYLDRIESNDSVINAITFINPNALTQARALDQLDGPITSKKPLFGIPIIVKDNINVKGMPTTAGSLTLKDFYPSEDAFIIQKLKAAGAIILAKSNMAEWAFSPMHTESSTNGITRNPYNPEFVPAGSSGGTAAAVAANFGLGGLGTDTGNSIRGPSAHCALVGFRTTLGLISRSGIVPLFLRNDVVGPMCRTVADATIMMEVMAGIDPQDDITAYSKGKAETDYQKYLHKAGLKGARIGVLREIIEESADQSVVRLFNQALADMDSMGATIFDPIVITDFQTLSEDQWCGTFRKDLEAFLAEQFPDSVITLDDIISVGTKSEFAQRRLTAYASASGRWGKAQTDCLDAYKDSRRVAFREAVTKVMDSLQLDAIVYPSWNNDPAHVDLFEEEYGGDNNQVISPHTGQPAFTVPMGFLPDNLPAGIQFLGRMYDEGTLIKLSYAYEQGTMHRKSAEPIFE